MAQKFDLLQALFVVAYTALLALAITLALVLTRQPQVDHDPKTGYPRHERN